MPLIGEWSIRMLREYLLDYNIFLNLQTTYTIVATSAFIDL